MFSLCIKLCVCCIVGRSAECCWCPRNGKRRVHRRKNRLEIDFVCTLCNLYTVCVEQYLLFCGMEKKSYQKHGTKLIGCVHFRLCYLFLHVLYITLRRPDDLFPWTCFQQLYCRVKYDIRRVRHLELITNRPRNFINAVSKLPASCGRYRRYFN